MKAEHILIIRFSAMGDVAMTVPVVYSLARQYPHLRITVLSRGYARPFFEDLAPNVGFMEADVKHEYHGINGLAKLYRRLAAKNFTCVADFHNVLRSAYLRMRFYVDRHPVAHINKHRNGKRHLLDEKNKIMEQQPTSFQNYADVLADLGYPVKLEFTSIYPSEGGNLNMLPAIIGPKKMFQQWIGIAPFAAHQGKIYPVHLMEKVVACLSLSHPQARIFLFGAGDKELDIINSWAQKYPSCISVGAHLEGIPQEMILMSHLDVMISMDSANMHFASLVNVPVVSVWGATHPFAGFMGWNQDPSNAVQVDLPCRPCSIYGNKQCFRGDYACMKNIDPLLIVDRVRMVLKKKERMGRTSPS